LPVGLHNVRANGKTPSTVSSQVATRVSGRAARIRKVSRRSFAVQLLGPLTMAIGLLWALVQPHRIAFVHTEGKGVYDYLVQPPLLVVLVGLVFAVLVAPGLVEDLEREEHGPEG
jgi:hypothetical protein